MVTVRSHCAGSSSSIDPVGPDLGYHLPMFNDLDALLISHLHPDHTYTQVVAGGTPNLVGLNANGGFQPPSAGSLLNAPD